MANTRNAWKGNGNGNGSESTRRRLKKVYTQNMRRTINLLGARAFEHRRCVSLLRGLFGKDAQLDAEVLDAMDCDLGAMRRAALHRSGIGPWRGKALKAYKARIGVLRRTLREKGGEQMIELLKEEMRDHELAEAGDIEGVVDDVIDDNSETTISEGEEEEEAVAGARDSAAHADTDPSPSGALPKSSAMANDISAEASAFDNTTQVEVDVNTFTIPGEADGFDTGIDPFAENATIFNMNIFASPPVEGDRCDAEPLASNSTTAPMTVHSQGLSDDFFFPGATYPPPTFNTANTFGPFTSASQFYGTKEAFLINETNSLHDASLTLLGHAGTGSRNQEVYGLDTISAPYWDTFSPKSYFDSAAGFNSGVLWMWDEVVD